MRIRFQYSLLLVAFVSLTPSVFSAPSYSKGVVATIHPLATDAALDALKNGGNAVDAAVSAALTLGVVDGHNSGIGGGCFLLIRLADGRVYAIDGRETAPQAATRDLFIRDGKAVAELSQTGSLAAGVPGEIAALSFASTNYGRLPFSQLLRNAGRYARDGFPINRSYAGRLKDTAIELGKFPESRAIFLKSDGSAWEPGHLLVQTDLAATYEHLAENGPGWLYQSPFPERVEAWMREHRGILRVTDFSRYQPKLREPVRGTYRGYEIISFPPPSSGGVHVIEILNILEKFDLHSMGDHSPEFVHIVAEAMKLAFADRAKWLGDPDFAAVPRGLVSKSYAATLGARILPGHTSAVDTSGEPPDAKADIFGRERNRHTTHLSAADSEGNWVALTATINTSFGSKVTVPGTGVVLNNQMDDFAAQPGVPNFFGLVGSDANSVDGGKRPLSSMSPTIVLKDGKPILSVGAAGGPTIISQTLLVILRMIDFGLPLDEALKAPRFHHQWRPDELTVERSLGRDTIAVLEKLGHRVVTVDALGAAQAVALGTSGQGLVGAADPRGEGAAGGR
jgi:gamma-glutamyltranspeptidase/glutathione hydrolase